MRLRPEPRLIAVAPVHLVDLRSKLQVIVAHAHTENHLDRQQTPNITICETYPNPAQSPKKAPLSRSDLVLGPVAPSSQVVDPDLANDDFCAIADLGVWCSIGLVGGT